MRECLVTCRSCPVAGTDVRAGSQVYIRTALLPVQLDQTSTFSLATGVPQSVLSVVGRCCALPRGFLAPVAGRGPKAARLALAARTVAFYQHASTEMHSCFLSVWTVADPVRSRVAGRRTGHGRTACWRNPSGSKRVWAVRPPRGSRAEGFRRRSPGLPARSGSLLAGGFPLVRAATGVVGGVQSREACGFRIIRRSPRRGTGLPGLNGSAARWAKR
jgi:hypothetical protein